MWETFSWAASLRVLQCVDPSLGLRFTLHSKMRASKAGVSVVGVCLRPHRLEGYMASNDPDFETKAADIIGLYLHPPQHAAVFLRR